LTVDIEQYLYEKPDVKASVDAKPAYTLLYVGSLIGRKGLDLLFASLPQTRAQIRLLVVGEGSEEQALREQVHELSIEDRVTFCGYAEGEELKGYYREADAFVLPTREDCYGLVLLEALCASLPVIASVYADGARDLIEDGVQGYLVDPYDAAALAGAIDAMFEDYGTLARMQKESYKRAKQFCFPAVAEGFFEALEDT
jgi:glycosyltransferase involved in cell wall biosynthesis